MTMTGRFVDHGVRILPAVALLLLVVVMSSPIRSAIGFHTAPPPTCLSLRFTRFNIEHSGQFAMSARPSLRELDPLQLDFEDELYAEIEDELTLASPPASVSYEVLPSPC